MPVALVAGDTLALIVACTATASAYSEGPLIDSVPEFLSPAGAFLIGVWVLTMWLLDLYERRIDLSVVSTLPRIVVGASVATMSVLVVSAIGEPGWVLPAPVGQETMVIAGTLAVVTMTLIRGGLRFVQRRVRRSGIAEKRTLIIGAGEVGTLLAQKMLRSPDLGLLPVAFWDAEPPESEQRERLGLPLYRRMTDLDEAILNERINHVLVAFSAASFHDIVEHIERCCAYPIEISVVPRLFEITAVNPRMDEIEGIPIARLHGRGVSRAGGIAKRTFDVVAASLLLLVTAPVFVAVTIAVRSESGPPVFFRQRRIGRDCKPFTMYKFRSMVPAAEAAKASLAAQNELSGPMFKMRHDPRVTRVGNWIRRYSVDELPQLLNVIKGDMSLVGPRPPLPDEVESYSEWHRKRLCVTPGMTGLWQILGRTELSFDEMVSLDLNYMWNWSLWLDISILARTLGAVLHGRGAS